MENYKYTYFQTIPENIKQTFQTAYHKDQINDYFYELDFDEEETDYEGSRYFVCMNCEEAVGIISIFAVEDTFVIYPYVAKKYRRQHVFSNLFQLLLDEIAPQENSPQKIAPQIEVHINENSIPYVQPILEKFHFELLDREHLMAIDLTNIRENPSTSMKQTQDGQGQDGEGQKATKTDISNDIPNVDLPEVYYIEDSDELELWVGETYIGGANIYYDDTLETGGTVTFYGYEILEEHRGKGYGKLFFLQILEFLREEMGFDKMILHVTESNKPAFHIYESCGLKSESCFENWGQTP